HRVGQAELLAQAFRHLLTIKVAQARRGQRPGGGRLGVGFPLLRLGHFLGHVCRSLSGPARGRGDRKRENRKEVNRSWLTSFVLGLTSPWCAAWLRSRGPCRAPCRRERRRGP